MDELTVSRISDHLRMATASSSSSTPDHPMGGDPDQGWNSVLSTLMGDSRRDRTVRQRRRGNKSKMWSLAALDILHSSDSDSDDNSPRGGSRRSGANGAVRTPSEADASATGREPELAGGAGRSLFGGSQQDSVQPWAQVASDILGEHTGLSALSATMPPSPPTLPLHVELARVRSDAPLKMDLARVRLEAADEVGKLRRELQRAEEVVRQSESNLKAVKTQVLPLTRQSSHLPPPCSLACFIPLPPLASSCAVPLSMSSCSLTPLICGAARLRN